MNTCYSSTYMDPRFRIRAGSVIFAGSIEQPKPDTVIGKHCIITTGVTADHSCQIKDGVHFAPGCHLSGGVTVCKGAFLGAGYSVIPECSIGNNTIVGA